MENQIAMNKFSVKSLSIPLIPKAVSLIDSNREEYCPPTPWELSPVSDKSSPHYSLLEGESKEDDIKSEEANSSIEEIATPSFRSDRLPKSLGLLTETPRSKNLNLTTTFHQFSKVQRSLFQYNGHFFHCSPRTILRNRGILTLTPKKQYIGELHNGLPQGLGKWSTGKWVISAHFDQGKATGFAIKESKITSHIVFTQYPHGPFTSMPTLIDCEKFIDCESLTQNPQSQFYKFYRYCNSVAFSSLVTKFEEPFVCEDKHWESNCWRYVGSLVRENKISFPHGACLVRVAPKLVVFGLFCEGWPDGIMIVETPESKFTCEFQNGYAHGVGVYYSKITEAWDIRRYVRGDTN